MDPILLKQFYDRLKEGSLWSADSKQFKGFAVSNPGEAAKIDQYVADLVNGGTPDPPVLATATGQGIVGMLDAAVASKPPPPPPPPPPVTGYNGVGAIVWSGAYTTFTNVDKMALIGTADQYFANVESKTTGTVLGYATGAQVASSGRPISIATARANGWLLHNSAGQEMFVGVNSSGYVANINNTDYATAWANAWVAFAQLNGLDGVHIDNFIIDALNFNPTTPALSYPLYDANGQIVIANQKAWEDAQIKWISIVGPILKLAGQYVMVNGSAFIAGDLRSNDGSLTNYWITRYAPYVSAVEIEYWLQRGDTLAMALSGPEWWNQWDGRSSVQTTAESLGIDFYGLVYMNSVDTKRTRYARASWYMNWNGTRKGGVLAFPNTNNDVWNVEMAKQPGSPTGPKQRLSTGIWTRPVVGGVVYINTTTASQRLPNGVTLASGDAILPTL